jgi:hypothetical protein
MGAGLVVERGGCTVVPVDRALIRLDRQVVAGRVEQLLADVEVRLAARRVPGLQALPARRGGTGLARVGPLGAHAGLQLCPARIGAEVVEVVVVADVAGEVEAGTIGALQPPERLVVVAHQGVAAGDVAAGASSRWPASIFSNASIASGGARRGGGPCRVLPVLPAARAVAVGRFREAEPLEREGSPGGVNDDAGSGVLGLTVSE